ncbi:MAG: flavodoxin family protein [Candidatus Methanofastidiosum sp.]|nr:flavodoxin family protein [Methanofastidiosum sp.]
MKKVTAFIGTDSKQATYKAVLEFEKSLKELGEIDFEIVFLKDYRLELCHSCLNCFLKGEEYCPSKDDRDALLNKIENSDGVIFATPNYTFQVTARMKNFIDRMAFIYHRPRFFDKAATAIVTEGVYGGKDVLKYLYTTGESLGFHVSKGCSVVTHRPMTEIQQRKLSEEVNKAAIRFYKELIRPTPPPSFFRLFTFRAARTSIKYLDKNLKDYKYYKEKGWFESDYYYPTSLGLIKKPAGSLFDFIARRMFKQEIEKEFEN